MATAMKHQQRSRVSRKDGEAGKIAFFNKCIWYAGLRAKAKEVRKANV